MPKTSRFPVYVKVWKAIVEGADLPNGGVSTETIQRVIDEFGEVQFRGAVHEAHELTFIHRSYLGSENEIPLELLRKVVRGPFSEVEENAGSQGTSSPRNFLFELTVAARLKRDGIPVELSGDADIEFNFRTYRCFIECKRLSSASAFDSNFRNASRQLKNRFRKFGLPTNRLGIRPLGMLFFAVNKALNPGQSFLQTPSQQEANRLIDEGLREMIMSSASRIRHGLHPNISSLVFYTHIQLRLVADLASYMRWSVFPYHNSDSRFQRAGNAILRKLRNSES